MALTSGSGALATPRDVCLSFEGPDTGDNFTDSLYHAMLDKEIVVYRDREDLHAGDRIDEVGEVGNSKIFIPVLSRGYASNDGRLRQLARAVELKDSTGKPEILPIFFNVTLSDLKLRMELYVKDLVKHEYDHGVEIRQQWEAALGKVGDFKGWEVQGKPHGQVIELVVKEVLRRLNVQQGTPPGRRRGYYSVGNVFETNTFYYNQFS